MGGEALGEFPWATRSGRSTLQQPGEGPEAKAERPSTHFAPLFATDMRHLPKQARVAGGVEARAKAECFCWCQKHDRLRLEGHCCSSAL